MLSHITTRRKPVAMCDAPAGNAQVVPHIPACKSLAAVRFKLLELSMTFAKSALTAAFALSLGFGMMTLSAAPADAATKERSAISKDCSAKADAQNLHGKARHAFRSKCKHDAKAAMKTKSSDGMKSTDGMKSRAAN